jgi:acetoacetyl-CoA reductase/3-oxoacyl-[acyl-carrier protein] reductase
MKELLRLDGQVALVTGGSGGIGSSIVEALHAAGAKVASLDLRHEQGGKGLQIDLDLRDDAALQAGIARVREELGPVKLFVHSAGITSDGVLWKMDDASWNRVLEVNLGSAFRILRSITPDLREGGGSVVFVTSINGTRGKFGQSNYAASKAGLEGLARTAARELGRFGVRVNCIAPGLIVTQMTSELPEAVLEKAKSEAVLGRHGEPRDVANAVSFLCSDMSRHITGQTIRVDGGQLIA